MKVYWKLNYSKTECSPIEFISETKCFVSYFEVNYIGRKQERMELKQGNIFPTFKEAKQHMIDHHKRNVQIAESNWQIAKSVLKKVNDLVKPKVEL